MQMLEFLPLKTMIMIYENMILKDNNFLYSFFFLRQGFSVALKPVLKLSLVDQVVLKLTEICLPLPPECWD